MRKLLLTPDQAQYGVNHPENTIATRLSGGLSKVRLDQVGGTSRVRVAWTLTGHQYQYLMAFWRLENYGANRFLIDLIIGSAELQEHYAIFVPGSLTLAGQTGDAYVVRAELEVAPLAEDPLFDTAVLDLYENYQPPEESHGMLGQLEQLTNVDVDVPALRVVDPVAAVAATLGTSPSVLIIGDLYDRVTGTALVAEAGAAQTVVALAAPHAARVYRFNNTADMAFRLDDAALVGAASGEERTWLVILRPSALTSPFALAGKQAVSNADGFNLVFEITTVTRRAIFRTTTSSETVLDLANGSAVDDTWTCLCLVAGATDLKFANDLASAVPVARPAGDAKPAGVNLRLGDSRLTGSSLRSPFGDVAAFVELPVALPDPQVAAAALLNLFLSGGLDTYPR